MSKRKSKASDRHNRCRYDVRMIQDFLDHLLWETRIMHAENTSLVTADGLGVRVNPELGNN